MSRQIPQGIEVLVLKAAVDPDFRQLLLERRTAAAAAIGLELTAAEATMLAAIPVAQLEAVIARASVPQEHRRAFLGQAAAAMLAALGATSSAEARMQALGGATVSGPLPPFRREHKTVEKRVIEIISERTGADAKNIKRGDLLAKDLGVKAADLDDLRKNLEKEFSIEIPEEAFLKLNTVDETIGYIEKALKSRTVAERVIAIISKRTGVEAKRIKRGTTLVRDLKAKPADLAGMREDLENEFDIEIPADDFTKIHFVANAITYVEKALKGEIPRRAHPPVSGGIRP